METSTPMKKRDIRDRFTNVRKETRAKPRTFLVPAGEYGMHSGNYANLGKSKGGGPKLRVGLVRSIRLTVSSPPWLRLPPLIVEMSIGRIKSIYQRLYKTLSNRFAVKSMFRSSQPRVVAGATTLGFDMQPLRGKDPISTEIPIFSRIWNLWCRGSLCG